MRIGVDIDGVLADFNNAFIDLIKEKTGLVLPRPSSVYPDVWNYHTPSVSKKQEAALWEHIKTSQFWGQLLPLPGALEAIATLSQMRQLGHDIYFITSRPGVQAKYLTERWLMLSGMDYPTVLIANDKGPVAKGLELDLFVDDKPENVAEVHVASPRTRVYLIDRPYNRKWQELTQAQGSMIRIAKSLGEVLSIENTQELERAA